MSNIILFDEEQNIVEIQYEGVNAQLLAELDVRLTNLENQTASDYFFLNAELDALQATVGALTIMVQQNYDDIQQEIDDRENADNELGEAFANEIILTQQMAADAIQEEATTRAAAIIAEAEARGTAIDTLETEINTDISAIAMTVEGLATNVAGNTAAIILVNEAVSTETEARSTQYSALLADFGDTNAAVLEESVARADADEAFASQLTIIEADVGDAYAAISAEATARADADSAMSASITAVTATANGAAAAVVTEQGARIAADGSIEAKYTIKIDVNGSVSGYGLIATNNGATPTSEFVVNANAFKIFNGSSAIAPFVVSGGIVTMTNVNVTASLNITNTVQTFTPVWFGFTTPPTGTISFIDLGAIVIMWVPSLRVGGSNSPLMSLNGIPAAARPSGIRTIPCMILDSSHAGDAVSAPVPGGVEIISDGGMNFFMNSVDGTDVVATGNTFSSSGPKGLPTGWLIVYSK